MELQADAASDIHCTVPAHISGSGEPVTCAIKSYQKVSEVPINWKTGIDMTAEVNSTSKDARFAYLFLPRKHGTFLKANITSTLLTEILDGHHSRMLLPFLQFINVARHKSYVCFGVLYDMHLWQLDDVSALHGAFEMQLTRAEQR